MRDFLADRLYYSLADLTPNERAHYLLGWIRATVNSPRPGDAKIWEIAEALRVLDELGGDGRG